MVSAKLKSLIPDSDMLDAVAEQFAVAVTDDVLETINPDDAHDPIARQYLPSAEELVTTEAELEDPIGDDAHSPVKGIVHRYPDRVLLKPVHVCAVYCRFCFRREKVGPGSEMLSAEELDAAIAYIAKTPQIWEVILTGGDPLILSPRRMQEMIAKISAIPHVSVIRIHTRIPVADPSRVSDDLIAALESDKAVYIVYHTNHANELTDKVRDLAKRFVKAGITLLSQSVLLKGVNNDPAVLEQLFRNLVTMKVKPYYLHHPDLAKGTSHFRLTVEEGQKVFAQLRGRVSGIALPKYILDIPGGFGKIDIAPPSIEIAADGYTVTNFKGEKKPYRDE